MYLGPSVGGLSACDALRLHHLGLASDADHDAGAPTASTVATASGPARPALPGLPALPCPLATQAGPKPAAIP